jgi:hypothetical protein
MMVTVSARKAQMKSHGTYNDMIPKTAMVLAATPELDTLSAPLMHGTLSFFGVTTVLARVAFAVIARITTAIITAFGYFQGLSVQHTQ